MYVADLSSFTKFLHVTLKAPIQMMVESSKRNFNLNQILPAPEDESDSLMAANANGVVGVIVQEESLAAESSTDTTTDDPSTAPARAQAERERREEMESGIKNMGMSALCKRVLGLPLDKTEQCSVWDRRPLRDLQVRERSSSCRAK